MKIVRMASVFIALGSGLQATGQPLPPVLAGNAALLYSFTRDLLIRHRTHDAFETFVAKNLIQHNPMAKDGRSAAINLVTPIIEAPGAQFTVSTMIADELYRMQAGKFVEHWDAFQPLPEKSVSTHPMFGLLSTSLRAPCIDALSADRALITGFADLFYRQKNVRAAFERYAAPNMIQHDPGLTDGTAAAIAQLTPILSRPDTHITIAHVLACHGMGVIHLRSQYGSSPGHVLFDIVRIDGGKIVENWNVFQPIAPSPINPRPPL
jgi:predicted SnoaL-like aldol condensation-catalyzing enzyme